MASSAGWGSLERNAFLLGYHVDSFGVTDTMAGFYCCVRSQVQLSHFAVLLSSKGKGRHPLKHHPSITLRYFWAMQHIPSQWPTGNGARMGAPPSHNPRRKQSIVQKGARSTARSNRRLFWNQVASLKKNNNKSGQIQQTDVSVMFWASRLCTRFENGSAATQPWNRALSGRISGGCCFVTSCAFGVRSSATVLVQSGGAEATQKSFLSRQMFAAALYLSL